MQVTTRRVHSDGICEFWCPLCDAQKLISSAKIGTSQYVQAKHKVYEHMKSCHGLEESEVTWLAE